MIFPETARILFFKAQQHALFDAPIVVPGHTRTRTGAFVAPYASHRKKRLDSPRTADLFGVTAQHPARTHAAGTTQPEWTLQATPGQVSIKRPKRPVAERLLNQASTGSAGGGSRGGNGGSGGDGGNGGEPPSLFNFSSSEIPADKNDSHAYRITAQAIAQPRYANQSPVLVTVKATQEPVWVSWRGIKHVLRDGNPTWQESLAALHVEALLESATKIAVEPDRFGRKDPIAIHRYQTTARFDGEAYPVILVVREHTDGKRYYDHSVIAAKTPAGLPASSAQNAAPTEPAPPFTGAISTIPPVAPVDKPPAPTPPVQAPLKNYGWDAVKLANAYSMEELNTMREHIEAQHANPKIEGRYFENGHPTLYLYDQKGRKKLESLSWAIHYKLKERTHKSWPLHPGVRILFFKAEVRGHTRRLASGKIVTVRPYHNRRGKKADETHPKNRNGAEPSPDGQQDVQRQMAAVVARYTHPDGTKAPGWLKAPNGEPTNLTERQWIQVRTENFKRWFGDWEYAAHQRAIDALATVPVDFPLTETLPLIEARHQALAEAKRRFGLDQKPKKVTAINGDEIWIAMSGLKESISKHAGVQKMRILPVLDRLIENSHFVLAAPDAKAEQRKTPNILGYRYYVAKAKLDGKSYYVKLAVREIEDSGIKRKFYDHDLSEVSEAIREQGTARLTAAGNPTAMTSLDHIVHHGWKKFNGDASKVIDAHGEPLAVYHGTARDFDAFNPRKAGKRTPA